MGSKQENEEYQITWLIRRLFRAMAHDANERLAVLGITAADRAVLEFLYPDKELAVPDIASGYQVSRQHVQTTANGLLAKGLIRSKSNPKHKRSVLFTLTGKGAKLFASVRDNDELALQKAFAGISRGDVAVTHKTLETVLQQIS